MSHSALGYDEVPRMSFTAGEVNKHLENVLRRTTGSSVRLDTFARNLSMINEQTRKLINAGEALEASERTQLEELADRLRRTDALYLIICERLERGDLVRSYLPLQLPSKLSELRSNLRDLDAFIQESKNTAPIQRKASSVRQDAGHEVGGDAALKTIAEWHNIEKSMQKAAEKSRGEKEAEGQAVRELISSEIARIRAECAESQAASSALCEAEIKGLRVEITSLMHELEVMKSAAVERDAVFVQAQVTLDNQRRETVEMRESSTAEVKGLKAELAALRDEKSDGNRAGADGSNPIAVSCITKDELESLSRLILVSGPFTTTMARLLSLTVGHVITLSIGCFAIDAPGRLRDIANECEIQHPFEPLGVKSISTWASDKIGAFDQEIKVTLGSPSGNAESGTAHVQSVGKMVGIGKDAGPEKAKEELAEKREELKAAWVDIIRSITAQQQIALTEITQHRTAATHIIAASAAQAVQTVHEDIQAQLVAIEAKSDRLDKAMLDFDRLHSAPQPSLPLATPASGMPADKVLPPSDASLSTIIPLLEQFLKAHQPAQTPFAPTPFAHPPIAANPILIQSDTTSPCPTSSTTSEPPKAFDPYCLLPTGNPHRWSSDAPKGTQSMLERLGFVPVSVRPA